MTKSHRYAMAFFEAIRPYNGKSRGDSINDENLLKVVEQCYSWKNLPDIAVDMLRMVAKEHNDASSIAIYEKLGDIAPDDHKRYLKEAKRLEARKDELNLDQVAILYAKAGDFDHARRALSLYSSKVGNPSRLADAHHQLADIENRQKDKMEAKAQK